MKDFYLIYVTGESYLDHSYTVIKELRKHLKLDVYFILKNLNEETQNFIKLTNSFPIPRKRYRNPFVLFDEIKLMYKLRKYNADCILFNTLNIYQTILVRFFLRNFLVMLHDAEIHPQSRDSHGKLSVKLTLFLHKRRICLASYSQAEIFKKNHGGDPKVLQLPIIDYYRDISPQATEIEKSLEPVKFFFFGSVEKYKGIETLLEAVEILNNESSRFLLRIYGRLKYDQAELSEKIKSTKNIELLDKYIDFREVAKIYLRNEVIVLPYRQVTQCGPLLIAYNFGVPAICSNLAGFREYVVHKKSGLLYGQRAEELAEAMKFFIHNSGEIVKMKEYIFMEIKNIFSMQSLAVKYMEVFRSI